MRTRLSPLLTLLVACGGLSPIGEDREVVFDSDTGSIDRDTDDDVLIPDTALPDTDPDTGDSGSSDTADTGDSGSGDTSDSGDSGDTGDSGDSGDTGDSGDSGDTGDSGTPTPTLAWDTVGWTSEWSDAVSTNTTTGQVTIAIDTLAVGGVAQLWIADTRFAGDYDEEHTLAQVSADPGGQWSSYSRSLACDSTFAGQTPDVNTIFDCQDGGSGVINDLAPVPNGNNYSVSYAAAVWAPGDSPGVDAPADCITFGRNGDAILAASYFNVGGAGEDHDPPAWLNSTNCRNVP